MTYNGELIRNELIRQGMTVQAFARKAGMSPTTVRFVLRGGRATHLRTCSKVANALGIDPPSRVLLDDEEAEKRR